MLRGYSFRPRRLGKFGALALAAACAAFLALGEWQSRRADEKRAAAARLERVAVEGEFAPKYTVYLDNRLRGGRPGYEVVTPLKLGGSATHVLIDRGWIAAGRTREAVPEVPTPPGTVRIEGVALDHLPRALGFEERGLRVRQNLEVAAYASETGLRLEPRVIEQHSELADGLSRDWPPHFAGAEKNESYALQWRTFAALAVILAIVLSFRRGAQS